MSTLCLPRGRHSSSSTQNLLLPLDLWACPAAKCNPQPSPWPWEFPSVANGGRCFLLEVTVNIPPKQARRWIYNNPGEMFCSLKDHPNLWWGSYCYSHISYRALPWGQWQNQRSIALVSTFYEHHITTNHPCIVTVTQVKEDFPPCSLFSSTLPIPEVVCHDKVSNHKSTWFHFNSCYHSTCLPSGCSLTPLMYNVPPPKSYIMESRKSESPPVPKCTDHHYQVVAIYRKQLRWNDCCVWIDF